MFFIVFVIILFYFSFFLRKQKHLKRAECVIVDLNPKQQDTSRNNILPEDIEI